MMGDGARAADMGVSSALRAPTEITRQVHRERIGVETVTESKNPEVTRLLQTHVAAMLARVKGKADRFISAIRCLWSCSETRTDRSQARADSWREYRVVETTKDAYGGQACARRMRRVVSAFLANGMSEMVKNHPVPPR